jgi:predicted ester cyclase
VVAEDDKVVGRISLKGHHRGAFMGVAPTNKPVSLELMEMVRVAQGKIIERWVVRDLYAALLQIGAVARRSGP